MKNFITRYSTNRKYYNHNTRQYITISKIKELIKDRGYRVFAHPSNTEITKQTYIKSISEDLLDASLQELISFIERSKK